MAVPEEIRKVPRPVNTVVHDSGRNGLYRYAVRERAGVKYVPGGNPQPRNGKVIGHIIDGKFVPSKRRPTVSESPSVLSFGAAALVNALSADLSSDLLAVFSQDDVRFIMALASLRSLKPAYSVDRLADAYWMSYISRYYPLPAFSAETLSEFLVRLDMNRSGIEAFFRQRAGALCQEQTIAVSTVLRKNMHRTDELSDFLRRGEAGQVEEEMLLYACDIEKMEPICGLICPEGRLDEEVLSYFMRTYGLEDAFTVLTEGPYAYRSTLIRPNGFYHFLFPIQPGTSDFPVLQSLIEKGNFKEGSDEIGYVKFAAGEGFFVYAFQRGSVPKKENVCSPDAKNGVPIIRFISNTSLSAQTAFLFHEESQFLEKVFCRYISWRKDARETAVGNISMDGPEFIDFIASLITARIVRKTVETGLSERVGFSELIEDLWDVWRKTDLSKSVSDEDVCWVHRSLRAKEEMETLGVWADPVEKKERMKGPREDDRPRRPRGRPKKGTVTP